MFFQTFAIAGPFVGTTSAAAAKDMSGNLLTKFHQ